MRRVPRIIWSILACVLCIIVTAAACLFMADRGVSSDKYLQIMDIIGQNYYTQVDTDSLSEASSRAMVEALNDRFSVYMNPEEYALYQLEAANQEIGIGITTEFSEKYGHLSVTSVMAGSPADAAHIRVGNLISEVNGVDVTEFTPEMLSDLLRTFGENDFKLLLRNMQGGKTEVTVHCELIQTNPVRYNIIEDTSYGYIRIVNFDDGASSYLKTAVKALMDSGVSSIIMDIRGNDSGKPAELADALDYFLPKGDLFLLGDAGGKETSYSSASSMVDIPLVIIVNSETSCAAEMFAYVMQANDAAVIVGQKTKGNGLSQTLIEMEDGSAVLLSKYQYLTPDKKSLEELGGVTPDKASYMVDGSEMDVQLEAAMDEAR